MNSLLKLKRRFKWNYLVIPLIVIATAAIGSFFTSTNMPWYNTELIRPELMPPRWVFPVAWNFIFLCCIISGLIIWNTGKKWPEFKAIRALIAANVVLNVAWTFLFFELHWMQFALLEMIILEGTTFFIALMTWEHSKLASILLWPYIAWVAFATYLTYLIVLLN